MNKKPALMVLAAGIGSRYGGLKQIDKVGPSGETIMDYSIYDAVRAGVEKVVFVIREEIQPEFHKVVGSKLADRIHIEYAFQELSKIPDGFHYPDERSKPWGTGHAILIAKDKIEEPFVVINADDFYGAGSYETIVRFLENSSEDEYAMVGFKLDRTLSAFGQVARGVCQTDEREYLESIVELTNIERKDKEIFYTDKTNKRVSLTGDEVVSMNIWGFHPKVFEYLSQSFRSFLQREASIPKSEYFIPTLIYELIGQKKASVKVLESTDSWFGVTYKEDKPDVIGKIRKLVDEGVYPESLYS